MEAGLAGRLHPYAGGIGGFRQRVGDNCLDREGGGLQPASSYRSPNYLRRRPLTDAATLSFALTYAGTLAVAALILIGQLAAFTALLALAGIVRLLVLPLSALTRRIG